MLTAVFFCCCSCIWPCKYVASNSNQLIWLHIPLILYTDSKLLFIDSVVSQNSKTEMRLLIDLFVLRQNYELRELSETVLVPTAQNPANAMTKQKQSDALLRSMQTNKISGDANVWIKRLGTKIEKSKTRKYPRLHRSV